MFDGAVEEVAEGLLVGLGHPEVEGAGVKVGAETAGVGTFGAATDAVGIERVAVRVEPLDAFGLVLPLAVQKRLDTGHTIALSSLHLSRGPVDRVDLGLGPDAAEEVVARSSVGVEEVVAVDIVDDVAVPGECLSPVEVTAHHQAAAAVQRAPVSRLGRCPRAMSA